MAGAPDPGGTDGKQAKAAVSPESTALERLVPDSHKTSERQRSRATELDWSHAKYIPLPPSLAGRPVRLTATEYELLRVLSVEAGRVVTYEALLRRLWNGRRDRDAELVRTFVKKLRRKLGEDAAKPVYIFNERGVGYRMARPDET